MNAAFPHVSSELLPPPPRENIAAYPTFLYFFLSSYDEKTNQQLDWIFSTMIEQEALGIFFQQNK